MPRLRVCTLNFLFAVREYLSGIFQNNKVRCVSEDLSIIIPEIASYINECNDIRKIYEKTKASFAKSRVWGYDSQTFFSHTDINNKSNHKKSLTG